MKRIFCLLLGVMLLLGGCAGAESTLPQPAGEPLPAVASPTEERESPFSRRDLDGSYEPADCTRIVFSGDAVSIKGSGAEAEGTAVSIRAAGSYLLTGSLDDGYVLVDVEKTEKVQLVLDGVSLRSESSAPLYIRQADKVFVTLAEGSENRLANGGSFDAVPDEGMDAALFSREDLTLNGSGSLEILSPAGHGVVSKDSLRLTGGSCLVDAASHGLSANDEISICTADFSIRAGKDGIHCENGDDTEKGFVLVESGSFVIESAGDGLSASAWMEIRDGTFSLCCGGGSENAAEKSNDFPGGFGPGPFGRGPMPMAQPQVGDTQTDSVSSKGLKAAAALTVSGGHFSLDCADDALHSDTALTVSEGSFVIRSGDDALHAEESLLVSGGSFAIEDCYEGLEALNLEIAGGELKISARDDGLNAAGGMDQSGFGGPRGDDRFGGGPGSSASRGSIVISGAALTITASGDGLDANGSIVISGGETIVCGPAVGDTATLDYDTSAVITGGSFLGTGGGGMAQTFSEASQGLLSLRTGQQSAGTEIRITDSRGNLLLSHCPELSYDLLVYSSPRMMAGESYRVSIGQASGDFQA